jgi:hypothetical protein
MKIVTLPTNTVELTVPGTVNFNEPLTVEQHMEYVKVVATRFDKWFGGATATPEWGFYQGVFEKSTRVWSYAAPTAAQVRAVLRIGAWVRATLNQDSVLVKVDGKVVLIFAD